MATQAELQAQIQATQQNGKFQKAPELKGTAVKLEKILVVAGSFGKTSRNTTLRCSLLQVDEAGNPYVGNQVFNLHGLNDRKVRRDLMKVECQPGSLTCIEIYVNNTSSKSLAVSVNGGVNNSQTKGAQFLQKGNVVHFDIAGEMVQLTTTEADLARAQMSASNPRQVDGDRLNNMRMQLELAEREAEGAMTSVGI